MSLYISRINKSVKLMRIGLILLLVTTSIVFIPFFIDYLLIKTFLSIIVGYSYNYNLFYSLFYLVGDYGGIFQIISLLLVLATFIVISAGMFSVGTSGRNGLKGKGIAGGIFILVTLVMELIVFFITYSAAATDPYTLFYSIIYGSFGGGDYTLPILSISSLVGYLVSFILLGSCMKTLKQGTNLSQTGLVSSYFFILVIILSILPYVPIDSIGSLGGIMFMLYSGEFAFYIVFLIISIEAIAGLSQISKKISPVFTTEPRVSPNINIDTVQNAEIEGTTGGMEKRYCENCGAPIFPNTKFCGVCGSAIH
jgi:hypothetical protein